MTSAALTAALIAKLAEHRACQNCLQSINDQGRGETRGWVHTLSGNYRCGAGNWAPEGEDLAYANPSDPEKEIDRRIEEAALEAAQAAREQGEETALADHQTECEAKQEEAYLKGRGDMNTELNGAITVALHKFMGRLTRQERTLIERLNDALTIAWESVEVDAS